MIAGIAAGTVLILGGILAILSKTVLPSMRNKVSRFFFWFVLWVPLGYVYDFMKGKAKLLAGNYLNIPLLGSPKMNWTEALILALLPATLFTFCVPQSHNSAASQNNSKSTSP